MSQSSAARGLRNSSSNSDIHSISAISTTRATLPHASPPPAYVSVEEAERLVYNELERVVNISESAIQHVNSFLDQILYDLLVRAHSTSLGALRAAVPIVLKHRLGMAAVKAADEELQDYLEEGEWDQLQAADGGIDLKAEFDAELAWKLTRLRCMVYARLGDMEEEDEEEYLDEEEMRQDLVRAKDLQRTNAQIAPAAAIFVTAVIEFVGEQALCIAAQHAKKRRSAARLHPAVEKSNEDPQAHDDEIYMDDIDLSGLGKEGPLIRLWRSWKGSNRSISSFSRPTTPNVMSPTNSESPVQDWKSPHAPHISTIHEEHSPALKPALLESPANIPLPMSDRDIDEIEVPGLARTFEDEDGEPDPAERPGLEKRRPSSMLVMPGQFPAALELNESDQNTHRPTYGRTRSYSLPALAKSSLPAQPDIEAVDESFPAHDEEPNDVADGAKTLPEQDPVDLEERPRTSGSQGLRSTAISNSAIAAVADAISAEASRTNRRHATYIQRAASAASTQDTTDDAERHLPQSVRTSTSFVSASQAHGQQVRDSRDLGFNPADEALHEEAHHSNLRDSGLGVASEDELPIQGVHEGDFDDDDDVVQEAQVATAHRATPPIDSTADSLPARATAYLVTSGRSQNMSGSPVTSSWSPVTPAGQTSFSQPRSTESSSERRFPQHLTSAQRVTEPGEIAAHSSGQLARYPPPEPVHATEPLARYPPPEPVHATEQLARYPPPEPVHATEQLTRYPPPEPTHAPSSSAGSHYVYTIPPKSTSGQNGRPGTAGSATARRQHLRLRSESEDRQRHGAGPDEFDAAKKSLDVLINSDETLHYTLTPEQARAGKQKPKVKTQTQELAEFFRTTAPPSDNVTRPKSSRSAKDALSGLRSNAPKSPTIPVPTNKSYPSPPKKNPLGEPREPRATQGNTRDLADYARSTGPEHEKQLPKPLAARTDSMPGVGGGFLRNGVPTAPSEARPSTTSSEKPGNRLKYQARDARPPRTAESTDLIDFIREGPPRAAGEHRIDRLVAPFRTTMDSDDLQALAPAKDFDTYGRYSDGSAQESAMTVKSMQSTINSRTGLLDSTNRGSAKYTNGTSAAGRQPAIPETEGFPQRTRRKPRDPYAIDFSDEELEEEEQFLPAPRRGGEEESLVDFLRNTAPPPGMTTQPILAAAPPTSEASGGLRRSASAAKLKEYLQGGSKANGARADSPHLTQVGSKIDKYRPTQPTHAPHVDRNRQRARVEARDATMSHSTTSDLATFLKESGPPASNMDTKPQRFVSPQVQGKDQAGFMKFFSRRGSVRKRGE